MHVKSVSLQAFRRFSDIKIIELPQSARLVILAGPNGNGKSSLFDAFMMHRNRTRGNHGWDASYYGKIADGQFPPSQPIEVTFHEGTHSDPRQLFYFRSAYRNDPDFAVQNLSAQNNVLDDIRVNRTIDNDAAVSINYQRLVSQGMEDIYEREDGRTTIAEFRDKSLGKIKKALLSVLPHLSIDSLGNPLKAGTFRFSKGLSSGYAYKNLSGGEKATFDLILDHVIKQRDFIDTVFCIDEPETHLNPGVHGKLLDALLDLTNEKSQLWIATHSVGMLRRARDIERDNPGTVAVLDFDVDFDQPQILTPVKMDRRFWQKSLSVALDDLATLVAPQQIIACESATKDGTPGEGTDSKIYNKIFSEEFPESRFISIGSSTNVLGDRFLVVQAVADMIDGSEVLRLIDRDGMSDQEKADHERNGVRVLSRRHIESYLFDDEILTALCAAVGKPEAATDLLVAKQSAIAASQNEGHQPDNMKKSKGRMANACRHVLGLTNAGKTTDAFMSDTLAPLITPSTEVYKSLRRDIFGIA